MALDAKTPSTFAAGARRRSRPRQRGVGRPDDDVDLACQDDQQLLGAVGVAPEPHPSLEFEIDRGDITGAGAGVHGPSGAHDVRLVVPVVSDGQFEGRCIDSAHGFSYLARRHAPPI